MPKKGTSLVKILHENYVETRIVIDYEKLHLAPQFYNQRILNQFKKLLKAKGIDYTYRKSPMPNVLISSMSLIIFCSSKGRFGAYSINRYSKLRFSFEAGSTHMLIAKLLRFRLISVGLAEMLDE